MKIFNRTTSFIFISLFVTAFISCGDNNEEKKAPKEIESLKYNDTVKGAPNIRYIDGDSLILNYDLAKKYSKEIKQEIDKINKTGNQKENQLKNLAIQIDNKLKNRQYTSEESAIADQKKFQQMEINAKNQIAKMQNELANKQNKFDKEINDSIKNYLNLLSKNKGYDFILNKKTATFYVNPKFDITDHVIKGLNEVYNKK